MTKSIAKKCTTGSLPPAVPLAITPTFSPWTHTSDDSYIYQLSLVLATATVSYYRRYPGRKVDLVREEKAILSKKIVERLNGPSSTSHVASDVTSAARLPVA